MKITLLKPCPNLLPSYLQAIEEGPFCNMALGFGDWSSVAIKADPQAYLAIVNSPPPWKYKLPNGSEFSISDHELHWLTDGSRFLGSVPIRYAGDEEFIENFAGHIGMAIRPSLLNKGYGVKALISAFELGGAVAKSKGLSYVLASCDQKNTASMRLIEHAGGRFFRKHEGFCGAEPNLIYKIDL